MEVYVIFLSFLAASGQKRKKKEGFSALPEAKKLLMRPASTPTA